MLVLTREVDQSIILRDKQGNLIGKVTVLAVRQRGLRDQVSLGFVAGEEVVIHREEVWDQINAGIPRKQGKVVRNGK